MTGIEHPASWPLEEAIVADNAGSARHDESARSYLPQHKTAICHFVVVEGNAFAVNNSIVLIMANRLGATPIISNRVNALKLREPGSLSINAAILPSGIKSNSPVYSGSKLPISSAVYIESSKTRPGPMNFPLSDHTNL